jgi:hypothetical protein
MKAPLELSMRQWQSSLMLAQSQAQSAHFPDMLATCQQIITAHSGDANALLDVGTLLLNFGYLARSRECFERVQRLCVSWQVNFCHSDNFIKKETTWQASKSTTWTTTSTP